MIVKDEDRGRCADGKLKRKVNIYFTDVEFMVKDESRLVQEIKFE